MAEAKGGTKTRSRSTSTAKPSNQTKKELDDKMGEAAKPSTAKADAGKTGGKRQLITKSQQKAAKADKKAAKGESNGTRVLIPAKQNFEELNVEIAKMLEKAYRGQMDANDFVELRALYDRGYRWARKLYEDETKMEASKIATKAIAQKAKEEEAAPASA